jgi:hypothetical protein
MPYISEETQKRIVEFRKSLEESKKGCYRRWFFEVSYPATTPTASSAPFTKKLCYTW